MSWLKQAFISQLGQKLLVALTGLALVMFLMVHLAGNMTILAGPATPAPGATEPALSALDTYAHHLHSIPGMSVVEIGLMLAFLLHIMVVVALWFTNRAARGSQRYAVQASKRSETVRALASRTMIVSGLVMLAFLVVHLLDFRVPREEYTGRLYEHVSAALKTPWRSLVYAIGSALVGFHLFHGVQSAFRSLGVNHGKYTPTIVCAGAGLSFLMGLGFVALSVWFLIGIG